MTAAPQYVVGSLYLRLALGCARAPDCVRPVVILVQLAFFCRGGKLLGKGGFGTVQTVIHKQTGVKYALKVSKALSLGFNFPFGKGVRALVALMP